MNALFTIFGTTLDGPHAQVGAEIVTQRDFSVSDGSTLGGFRLNAELSESGPGVFWFGLQNTADVLHFRRGETLELNS